MEVFVTGDIEKALRTFKNRCERAGLRDLIKRHQFFLSKSDRRRLKDRKNMRRLLRKQAAREQKAGKTLT